MSEVLIAGLKKQRSINKCKLTNLVKYARQDHKLTDLGELTTRLRRVEKLMEEFTDIETRIFTADPTEESDLAYEENYYTAITTLNNVIRSKSLHQRVISLDNTHNETQTGEHSQVKLPKIHIPPFNGDYSEWQSFYDMYSTIIHESPSLSPVQKFQYLKGLLRGEAAILLRHISVTEGNYMGALNKLKERYDRKKYIISTFIRTFIEQPAAYHPTVANIKRIMDTSDEVIRGLQALGDVGETRDPWLIHILLQKLDDKSKTMWAEHSADIVNPEFTEFLKFLGRRIDTLETLSSTTKQTNSKAQIKGHVASENTLSEIEGHAAVRSFSYKCAMCQDTSHSIFQCSQFQALNSNERKEFAKSTNRCFNCLSSSHPIFRCTSRRRCQKCGKKHNTLLHSEETPGTSAPEIQTKSTKEITTLHVHDTSMNAILPTAIVSAVDYSGRTMLCRALLDSGSQASFITEAFAQRLRLQKRNARISISGLGQSSSGTSKGIVTITLKPTLFPEFSVEALVMSRITSKLPPRNINIDITAYNGIKLADPKFNKSKAIDLLIGADHFFDVVQDGKIKPNPNGPVLQNTVFGWVISGSPGQFAVPEVASMMSLPSKDNDIVDVDRTLRKFWELESLHYQENILSPEESFCERHFVENLQRNSQGRYVVKLPFKEPPSKLGESLPAAIQRLRGVERRFIRDPLFSKLYQDFMSEYQSLGHMVEITKPKSSENQFFLPHHGVLKPSSSTSKLRVVFDGSAKSSTGFSLNDCLAVGPTVQSTLYAIILRFREYKYAFSSDIEKMYRQVVISPEDSKFQQILWRCNPSEPLRYFRLKTITYGLASSSFLATRVINQISQENKNSEPHASGVIARNIYVDDLMAGADNEDEALQLKEKVTGILQGYGFHLRKWKSNNQKILSTTPQDLQDLNHKEIHDHSETSAESIKVLGIEWNPKTDSFTFTSRLPASKNFTKRTVLSEASRLFDPLGWLAPIIITFKIFLQLLWGDNLQWDDPLPHDRQIMWEKIRNNLQAINFISIPRFINTVRGSITDIHGFCDASQSAYAAVVYFKTITSDGQISIQLVSAKTKVAPIKQQTLPRLELCAAVLLTKLIEIVKKESNVITNETFAWTDSQIVLDWLADHPRRWSTFVGNRTAEILTSLSRKHWLHVPSADNPADCASRGLSPTELKSHPLWWNGPNWLLQSSNSWPLQKSDYGHQEEKSKRITTFTIICAQSTDWFDDQISKYSSFYKLQRVLCYVLRYINNSTKPKVARIDGIHLRREELFEAVHILCKHEQRRFYKDDIKALQSTGQINKSSPLKSLDPFIDDSGLLRVGGRLHNSLASYSTKHPAIISPKSRIAFLILRDMHLEHKHAGPTLLLSISRQQYWIPGGKMKAKEVIRKCVTCIKFKADCQQQLMGSLPKSRVQFIRPFLKTGVDYAGPISIHLTKGRGQKTYKAYIALFICLSIKAVHLELVTDLSSEAFLGALKRFTARRGVCCELLSDNGTNFIGSNTKLQKEFNKLIQSSNTISNYLSSNRITWKFIPPSSPHFGGLWEAAIKAAKFHIKRVIGKNILTLEEMNTLLAEVEAILNSRPLCAINDTEIDALTPAHFLIGHPYTTIPECDITHLKSSHLNRWQLVQQLSQHFWKRWHNEYLTSLQQRTRWRTRKTSIQMNDIVLIKDTNLPVNQWPLARVIELHPGSDGLVRVVTLKTQNTNIKRPIHKLCVLPASDDNPEEQ